MKTKIYALIVVALALMTAVSCKKDDDKAAKEAAAQSIEDNANAESAFDNIFNLVDDKMSSETENADTGNRSIETGCPTVTSEITNGIITLLVIDFGETYCTPNANTGDRYKGRLVVTANGRYRETGTVITASLEDFYFNDYHIEGTKTFTNLGRDVDSLINYSIVVEGGKLTAPSGEYTAWQSNQNRRWLQGETSWWWPFDDVYEVTGTASGTNANGVNYTINVTDPLWARVGCRYIQQGGLTVTTDNVSVQVDYGTYQNNVCDNSFTYTVNGNNYNSNVN